MHRNRDRSRAGFTLVELAVVLVIIGLLAGGIFYGTDLLRGARNQSVIADFQKYQDAARQFQRKYGALPGDLTDATDYWGASAVCSGSVATGACNGNGDGILNAASIAGATGEIFQFWRQLALAGLIEGTYSGVAGAGGTEHAVPGSNSPISAVNGAAGWSVKNLALYAGDASTFAFDYGNALILGARNTTSVTNSGLLSAADALKIDSKLDNGIPATGNVIAGSITTCTNASGPADTAATYSATAANTSCSLYFAQQLKLP